MVDIDAIKHANPIDEVIGEDEPLAATRGRYVRSTRHDSLVVDRRAQTYHWNSAGEWGDVIEWLVRHRNMDFRAAVEHLARRAGLPEPQWSQRDAQAALAFRAQCDALTAACDYWTAALWRAGSPGLAYARGRGWNDETIRSARLGYVDGNTRALRGHLQMHGVDLDGPVARAVLQAPAGMLVYPCLRSGRVVYFMCRNAGAEKRHWNPPAELLGERQPYYNYEYDPRGDAAVVVEGPADAITLAQWGIAAVALAGTAVAATETYVRLLAELRKHPVVLLGLDEGAEAAATRIADALGPLTRIVTWPAHDANEWLQQGATAEDARALLDAAPTWAEVTAQRVATLDGRERDRALRRAFELFARMPEFDLAALRPALARELDVNQRQFNALLRAASNGQGGKRTGSRNGNGNGAEADGEAEDGPAVTIEIPGGWVAEHLLEMIAVPPEAGQSGQIGTGWKTQFAVRMPDGELRVVNYLDVGEVRIRPMDATSRIITERVVLFPSALGEKRELTDLVAWVRRVIHRYVDVEPTYEALAAYYVLFTWLYDCFDTVAYLRMLGEAGSGKSRFLQVVGSMCYRPIRITGATTTSPIFRILDQYRGTLIADEMDFRVSDEKADIIKILLVGYQREQGFVLRSGDKNTGFATEVFVVYGPKLIATRRRFQDNALESRCITHEVTAPTTRTDIPLHLEREFWTEETQAVRNALLRMRLERWQPEMRVDASLLDTSVEPRLNQVTGALQTIITDDELRESLRQFIREFNAQMVTERGMTLTAKTLEAVCGCWFMDLYDGREPDMRMSRLAEAVNILIDEENAGETDEDEGQDNQARSPEGRRVTAKKIGEIVRKQLQLRTERRTEAGRAYVVCYDHERITGLRRRYGVTEEWLEDVIRTLRAKMGRPAAQTVRQAELI